MSLKNNNNLLIEFLTEELPPIDLVKNIGAPFAEVVFSQLKGFVDSDSQLKFFVAPRRFGCVIEGIDYKQTPQKILRKGPAIATGLKDGKPTPALIGFAKSCATEWTSLNQRDDGYFYHEAQIEGKTLADVLNDVIDSALKKVFIAKAMHWGDSEYQFVRPVHNLMVMFNERVIECEAFGLKSNTQTLGHRFMSAGAINISNAASYLVEIESLGKVIPEFNARRILIENQLQTQAAKLGLAIAPMTGLLDEVTALVEWPEVLIGEFDQKFLAVPQECLILSMAKNQKYFALVDHAGKLTNKFLFVANLISQDPQVIIHGNQKVLTARLADAEFFYQFDQRTPLCQFVDKMNSVVYHNKLGSQLARIKRLQVIAGEVAPMLKVDASLAQKTAYLLKADLATEMVGEFPELQGIMGKYYALINGESSEVANAIEKHYYPRFSGDELPDSDLATVVSLADKLESLIGIWGIGLIPTGDKDPYALRRAALGIVRILLARDLDIKLLLTSAFAAFAGENISVNTVEEVFNFIIQRLSNYLISSEGYTAKVVNAVLNSEELSYSSASSKKFNHLLGLLDAVSEFSTDEKNQPLFQANKRIENILKKNESELVIQPVTSDLLCETAERELFNLFNTKCEGGYSIVAYKNAQNWDKYFGALTIFNQPLDKFFNEVMVMSDDMVLRQNRLNLLQRLHKHFNLACQLSELA